MHTHTHTHTLILAPENRTCTQAVTQARSALRTYREVKGRWDPTSSLCMTIELPIPVTPSYFNKGKILLPVQIVRCTITYALCFNITLLWG